MVNLNLNLPFPIKITTYKKIIIQLSIKFPIYSEQLTQAIKLKKPTIKKKNMKKDSTYNDKPLNHPKNISQQYYFVK